MDDFNVDDRVVCIKSYEGRKQAVGKTGTVICITSSRILVEFDEEILGHNGEGRSKKMNHCWFYDTDTASNYLAKDKPKYQVDLI